MGNGAAFVGRQPEAEESRTRARSQNCGFTKEKKTWRERSLGIFLWNFWDEAIRYVVTPTIGPKTLEYVFPPKLDNADSRREKRIPLLDSQDALLRVSPVPNSTCAASLGS